MFLYFTSVKRSITSAVLNNHMKFICYISVQLLNHAFIFIMQFIFAILSRINKVGPNPEAIAFIFFVKRFGKEPLRANIIVIGL